MLHGAVINPTYAMQAGVPIEAHFKCLFPSAFPAVGDLQSALQAANGWLRVLDGLLGTWLLIVSKGDGRAISTAAASCDVASELSSGRARLFEGSKLVRTIYTLDGRGRVARAYARKTPGRPLAVAIAAFVVVGEVDVDKGDVFNPPCCLDLGSRRRLHGTRRYIWRGRFVFLYLAASEDIAPLPQRYSYSYIIVKSFFFVASTRSLCSSLE